MALTTRDRVRQLATVASSGPNADALIDSMIEEVSSSAIAIMRRHGPKAGRTEVYNLRPRRSLILLDGCPIDLEGDVEVIVDDVLPVATDALPSSDYILNAEAGWVQLLDWPGRVAAKRSRSNVYVQITYTAGLAEDVDALVADPRWQDVVGAVTMQVQHYYQRRDKLGGELKVAMGGGMFSSDKRGEYGLLPEVERVLKSYRRSVL